MKTELLYLGDSYLKSCETTVAVIEDNRIQLAETPFYPMGGGQPGDTGVIETSSGEAISVTDTRKDRETGSVLHSVPENHGLTVGEKVTVTIDWPRRHRFMRMHTCLHLLCSLVDGGVTGGSVSDVKGRLDFDLPEQTLDKVELTERLNELIQAGHAVSSSWISDAALEEKPELVRTMSVKPPMGQGQVRVIEIDGVDLQPCGGTHVSSTAEIGPVRVSKIEKKGRANRRVNIVFEE